MREKDGKLRLVYAGWNDASTYSSSGPTMNLADFHMTAKMKRRQFMTLLGGAAASNAANFDLPIGTILPGDVQLRSDLGESRK